MGILASLIASLFMLAGLFISFGFRKTDRFLQFLMASTLGLGASLIMVELLPDAASGIGESFKDNKLVLLIGYILIGVIITKLCDVFLPDHSLTKDNKKNHYLHIGLITCNPIIIYNIIVGMKINITTNPFLLGFGLGICNLLFGLLLAGLLSKSLSKKNLIVTIIIISLAPIIGTIFHMILSNYFDITSSIMTILGTVNLGMLIYIMLNELFLNLLNCKNTYITVLGIIFGTIILFISHLFYI